MNSCTPLSKWTQPKWQVVVFLGIFRSLFPADDSRLRDYFLLDPHSRDGAIILEEYRHLFETGPLQPPLRVGGQVYRLLASGGQVYGLLASRPRRTTKVEVLARGHSSFLFAPAHVAGLQSIMQRLQTGGADGRTRDGGAAGVTAHVDASSARSPSTHAQEDTDFSRSLGA